MACRLRRRPLPGLSLTHRKAFCTSLGPASKKSDAARLADSDEAFRSSAAGCIRRAGYDVSAAATSVEAEAILRAQTVNLLICDVALPPAGDLHWLATLPALPPTVLIAESPSLKSAVQGLQMQLAAYLVKPVDCDELVRRVALALP